MPGNPAQSESNRRTWRGPPGFVSTRFRPFLILSLRQAEVRKMRGGLRNRAAYPPWRQHRGARADAPGSWSSASRAGSLLWAVDRRYASGVRDTDAKQEQHSESNKDRLRQRRLRIFNPMYIRRYQVERQDSKSKDYVNSRDPLRFALRRMLRPAQHHRALHHSRISGRARFPPVRYPDIFVT